MNKKKIAQIADSLIPIPIDEISTQYFLQSSAWARVKMDFSWNALAFRQEYFSSLTPDILVLVRKLPIFGYLAYIPDGIIFGSLQKNIIDFEDDVGIHTLQELFKDAYVLIAALQVAMQKEGYAVFCVRWDTPCLCQKTLEQDIEQSSTLQKLFESYNDINSQTSYIHIRTRETVQPPATVMLDLTKSKDDLLAHMKQKTRYNTRLAAKKGVEIDSSVSLDEFYEIYEKTSKRNNISIHSKLYYEKVIAEIIASKNFDVCIYGARFEGILIAAIIVVYIAHNDEEKTALYLYGASSDEYRNIMPAYALQWRAISDAQDAGCSNYDMFGIPLKDDVQHRMHGIYKFKIGFGGKIRFRLGCIEIFVNMGTQKTLRKCLYHTFLLVEKLRLWYYYKYKKTT